MTAASLNKTSLPGPFGFIAALLALVCALCLVPGAQAQEVKASPDYRLGAGDAIRISVFQNPDMTVETRVSESGQINYPLIGTMNIGGMSIGAAEQLIAKALKDGGFIKQPQVNILLLLVRGNQVSVLGYVNRPGRFPLEAFNARVSDMIATAGGILPTGGDTVILTGTRDGKAFRQEIDIAGVFVAPGSAEDLPVAGGDVIYVNRAPMFYIYGEAQRPGAYRIERGMTLRQALATGGGPTARGTESRVRVDRRKPDGKVERVTPDKDELVQPEDVIYVRESLF